MARLIYSAIMSLDHYVADGKGNWDWSVPDEDVHTLVNDLARPAGTHLLGRRMYEVLTAWETIDTVDQPRSIQDFAQIWKEADKIVYSRSLKAVSTAKTRLERSFEPDAVRKLKAEAERDITIGGPELAAQGIRAGLVDEYQMFVSPIVVGAGTPFLPNDVHLELELLDERRFGNGVVYLRYRAT